MNLLKEKLAQRIKKAAEQRKRQLQKLNQRNEKPINPPNIQIEQSQPVEVQSLFSQMSLYQNSCPIKKDEGNKDELIEVYSLREQQILMDPFIVQTQKQPENEEDIERDIEIMVGQKESRHKQEQEEKKKELILNAIKNKKKPRPPKPMDKPTPFNELSPPYQQIKVFASYLPIYEERRRRQHYSTIVDLGVKNLPEIVLQCFLEGIISKKFMKETKTRGVELQIDFVRKFAENKLDSFDFNACKFTPLDHRWLCGRLLNLPQGRGQKYMLGQRVYCVFKEISDFYEIIYAMQQYQYQKLCEGIRIKYKLTWRQSAFQNFQPLDQQAINKIDTSTIYKMRPSPLFGADLEDEQKQFFKAKKEKYPDKVKAPAREAKSQTSKSSQMGSKSEFSDSDSDSSSDSFDSLSLKGQVDDELESDMLSQSLFKSSTFSGRRISKRKSKQSCSNSSLSQKKQSEVESDSVEEQDDIEENMSSSMFRSKSRSSSKRDKNSQLSKNEIKKRKQASKANERKMREQRDSMDSNSQDFDIFDD